MGKSSEDKSKHVYEGGKAVVAPLLCAEPEDVQAAIQFLGQSSIGFLPGTADQKMRAFNVHVREKQQARIFSDNIAGVTSEPVMPMQAIKFKPRC